MTADLILTPKKTATTAILVVIGIAALAFVTLHLPKPVAQAEWRHDAAATGPASAVAPSQMRARAVEATAVPAVEASIARGRN